jgi:hypothetical protein
MIKREDIILSMLTPEITESGLLDAFSRMSNHELAEKYNEVTGIFIVPIVSGYFLFATRK